ncbi:MAG: anthranilate phosphoribosyltransferase [bacterium]
MIKDFLKRITEYKNLSRIEAKQIITLISEDKITYAQIGSLLTALKMKGETVEELTGFAQGLIELAQKIDISHNQPIVDSCGTGGDGTNTFNISTASAVLASACGVMMAKHSNFGYTSLSGSSNVVEALGFELSRTSENVINSLSSTNIAFLHAPYFHTSTRNVVAIRKELGFRTFFNYIGPLTNPIRPTGQVLGVADNDYAKKLSQVLLNLGCERAMVVNGENPTIDELNICGKTNVYKIENGKIEEYSIYPEDLGLKTYTLEELKGGKAEENAKIVEEVLSGKSNEAKLYAVLLNTSAILWAGGKCSTLEEGIIIARDHVENGMAEKKILELKNYEL